MVLDRIKRDLVPAIFSRIPWSYLGSWTKVNPIIAYYHIVSDYHVAHVSHLYAFRTVRQFRQDLDTFLKAYKVISLQDLLGALSSTQPLPKEAFLLTFDDGFREIHDVVAPILLEKGLPATFFITTACLDNGDMAYHNKISLLLDHLHRAQSKTSEKEILSILSTRQIQGADVKTALLKIDYRNRDLVHTVAEHLDLNIGDYLKSHQPYVTSDQVRKLLERGFAIGGHSIDHPLYAELTVEEQLRQTQVSVRDLRQRFDLNYGAFAFPHGARGVGARFFSEVFADGIVDVTFGTAGMLKAVSPRHLERFSMEYTGEPAERIIGGNYARSLFKRMAGRQVIPRT